MSAARKRDDLEPRLGRLERRVDHLADRVSALESTADLPEPAIPPAPAAEVLRCPGCHLEVASPKAARCPWCGFVFAVARPRRRALPG